MFSLVSIATFLVGAAFLSFEILGSRTLGFVLGPAYIYLTLALAMLAMSAAGSVMSLVAWRPTEASRARAFFTACLALALALVASYYATAWAKSIVNARMLAQGASGGAAAALAEAASSRPWIAMFLGAVLSVAYFLFGFILAALFQTIEARQYPSIYAADLIGGSAGCVAMYWLMEHTPFAVSLMLPPLALVGAALAFVHPRRTRTTWVAAAAVAVVVCLSGTTGRFIEPGGELHQLGRDYAYRRNVSELWHGWNSFSRVTAVETVAKGGRAESWMTFGNGEGHAALLPPRSTVESQGYVPSRLAMVLGPPNKVLVLFAGAGADMMALDEELGGAGDITGVELNTTMVEGAKSLPKFQLDRFFRKPNIHLVLDDARAFVERTTDRYDVVLLSWAGASPAFFDGSIASTTSYVFTRQAMERIFDRLRPGGYIVYLSTNKMSLLAAARDIMDQRGMPDPHRAVVVLKPRGSKGAQWTQPFDTNALLVKPDGFSAADVERISTVARSADHDLVYSPFEQLNMPDSRAYETVLTRPVLADALAELGQQANLRLEVITDDRPYAYDLFRRANYLSRDFWKKAWTPTDQVFQQYRAQQLLFVAAIAALGAVLIVGPLLFKGRLPTRRAALSHGSFFAVIGAGFMYLEVGLMQKALLLLGDPGLSIALILAVLVLSAGLGSLASARLSAAGLTIRGVGAAVLVYGGVLAVGADAWVGIAMGQPLGVKCIWLAAVIAPAGFLMGQLMPMGLARARREDVALVPWGWAINGVLGTLAAGLSQTIGSTFGIQAVMYLGLLSYACLLALPVTASDWQPRPAGHPADDTERLLPGR